MADSVAATASVPSEHDRAGPFAPGAGAPRWENAGPGLHFPNGFAPGASFRLDIQVAGCPPSPD